MLSEVDFQHQKSRKHLPMMAFLGKPDEACGSMRMDKKDKNRQNKNEK